MFKITELTYERFEREAEAAGVSLPIEQTGAWATYQATIPGRSRWGCFAVERAGEPVAFVSFIDFETHGYHFLRSMHGPAYVGGTPDAELEREVVASLADYVRRRDRKVVFIRFGVTAELDLTQPTLSMIPYDTTVVMDLTGGDEAIIERMKKRGRRDVRKALRESPATYADETEQANASFDEYYDVMVETAERDGFTPSPQHDYEDMLRILGPERCRVFAGRIDGRVVTWTITTVAGTHAVRYYGASRADIPNRNFVTDGLIYFESCVLGARGIVSYDMMGIGSEAYPGLMTLNTFKCKFAQDVTAVAPDRDVPLRTGFYGALQRVKSVRDARRAKKESAMEKNEASAPRTDLVPVILGGDIGTYALGREFHEAYGVKSVCVGSAPIGAITHSAIFDVEHVDHLDPEPVLAAVRRIAAANPDAHVFLTCNTDALVALVCGIQAELPANVVACVPPMDVVDRLSDKVTFAQECTKHGIEVAATEVVNIATADLAVPTKIAFPLVAKPARSTEYAAYIARGFQKVYYVQSQDELTGILTSLREAGYTGDYLVQELIEGDDTYMDSITVYVDSKGKTQMFGSAHVLLEDHAPSMLGNPVAMITQQVPDLWEKVAALLEDNGYRGFANFDIKRDPKTGRRIFLEVNPRIGRNSYYNCAGGVNPMRCAVEDLVDGKPLRKLVVDDEVLYTLVPISLLRKYVRDADTLAQVDRLVREGKVHDPQRYSADRGLRRMIDVELTEKNQVRKFAKYYPKPTDTSF